jgi:hypothetical protein
MVMARRKRSLVSSTRRQVMEAAGAGGGESKVGGQVRGQVRGHACQPARLPASRPAAGERAHAGLPRVAAVWRPRGGRAARPTRVDVQPHKLGALLGGQLVGVALRVYVCVCVCVCGGVEVVWREGAGFKRRAALASSQ